MTRRQRVVRGFDEKYVCPDCIDDYAIKEFINENATNTSCHYCGKSSEQAISTAIEEVADFILARLWDEWDDPNECMGWEDGYVGATLYDTEDLIRDEVDLGYSNQGALDDLVSICSQKEQHSWCQKDPYGLRKEDALYLSWNSFCEQVKHTSRFNFLRIDSPGDKEDDQFSDLRDTIPASKMLDRISKELTQLEEDVQVIKELDPNVIVWRTRIHPSVEHYNTAKDLGTVPVEKANQSNRMSPAGIPMFYGAFDSETAIVETTSGKDVTGQIATTGVFKNVKTLKILDLTTLPEVPSLFDESRNYLRSILIFMREFVRDLSRPISKDGMVHIDYVPTQMFTEYIRYVHQDINGDNINGIIYPSSQKADGKAIVLFLENKNCVDKPAAGSNYSADAYLMLDKVERRSL